MNEEYGENQEMDTTAGELPPETDTGESAETGTDNETFETDNGELEEGNTETVIPLPEPVPDSTELPSVSANDVPSVLPPPVGPSETDNAGDPPADSPGSSAPPITELLENAQNFDDLLAAVRELSETVSAQTYGAEPSGIPISGYEGYSYPVSVVYRIFPPALGTETGYSGTYADPEAFNTAYKDLQADVQAGSLSYCYVRYVYDSNDECVYDSEEYRLSDISIEGYADYSYPITVKYRIFPSDLGKETFITKTLAGPEEFNADYKEMQRAVSAGNLDYCRISTVTDAEGVLVYDSEALPEQPEEPDETVLSILEALGEIETDLQSIADADTAYRTEMMLLQEQNAELLQQSHVLQQNNETIQKEFFASNVAIGFILILTLGYTVAHGFFQRMKAG